MASDYCTAAEVKDETDVSDSDDDAAISRAITAASRQIDRFCGRSFWQDPTVTTREFYASSPTSVDLLEQDGIAREISTTTGLIVAIDEAGTGTFGTTLTVGTDFLLMPRNASADGRGFSEIYLADNYTFPRAANGRAGVQVTAQFGWPSVPDDIKEAAIRQAIFLHKGKDAAFGVASFDGSPMQTRDRWHTQARALILPYQIPPVG